ncbi:MAG TPA: HK97 gp10 family phage protein [Methanothrix sp.]|nr:HK97 gp10 family phage protein [Methanothrix sp.]HOL44223.1 HK97 gp10 family phage protein [Methanothrix sp.]
MSFRIDFSNYSSIVEAIRQIESRVDSGIDQAAKEFVMTAVNEVKLRTPVRTGHLRAGTQGDVVEKSRLHARVHVWNPVYYAPFVEFRWGGKYSYFRPGISVALEKMRSRYREILISALGGR